MSDPIRRLLSFVLLASFLLVVTPQKRALAQISAVWANEGGDKVTQDELRASAGAESVISSVWDGGRLSLFGARNEVLGANFVIETGSAGARRVSVRMSDLVGPAGYVLRSPLANREGIFDWTGREIETFYVRYLRIMGLSINATDHYDERHVPERMRRPWSGEGMASGGWRDRPDREKMYPDIAVPIELHPVFDIAPHHNQSIWVDIYVPKDAPAGRYVGSFSIREEGRPSREVPVSLRVRNFRLSDVPATKTMLVMTPGEVNLRYFGDTYVDPSGALGLASIAVRDNHFKVAHRHKLSLITDNYEHVADEPPPEWIRRLDGTLFTPAHGYEGPGTSIGNDIFAIGLYGGWDWRDGGEAEMRQRTDNWERWFASHSPNTERFLYLIDESHDYPLIESWSRWMRDNPGPGRRLLGFATIGLPSAIANTPSLSIAGQTPVVGNRSEWEEYARWGKGEGRRLWFYNGKRPASGSFAIEDDGVALRELPWGQHKMGVQRWFFWESTYYRNYNQGLAATDVFSQAQTFGSVARYDDVYGMTASDGYSNGDGVLFYPGTDQPFGGGYGINGPIASLRLKHWRRGIQDVDYIALASRYEPEAVSRIVSAVVPKALWEYDAAPGEIWKRSEVSWSNDPDVWEAARASLAAIIEAHSDRSPPSDPEAPPEAPSSLGARRLSTDSVVLEWIDESSNEDGFVVQRSDNGGEFVEVARAPAGSTSLSFSSGSAGPAGLVPGYQHAFRLSAYNAAGSSPWTPSVSISLISVDALPSAPKRLRLRRPSRRKISIRWKDRSTNELAFVVERSADGLHFEEIARLSPNSSRFTYRSRGPFFRVGALGADGAIYYSPRKRLRGRNRAGIRTGARLP